MEKLKIKVGGEEKEFTPEELGRFVEEHSKMSAKIEGVEAIHTAAAKYDLTPEEYVIQAEGSFGVMNNLLQNKVIDQSGKLIKTEPKDTPPKDDDVDPNAPKLTKAEKVIMDSLNKIGTRLDEMEKGIDTANQDAVGLMRLRLQDKIKERYPDLDDESISKAIARSSSDKSKDVFKHAEDINKDRAASVESVQRAYAKEHGLDYEALAKAKEVNEENPDGGVGAMFQNKNFTFNPQGENDVSPQQAAKEFLDKNIE